MYILPNPETLVYIMGRLELQESHTSHNRRTQKKLDDQQEKYS